jgi:hypothetical protein
MAAPDWKDTRLWQWLLARGPTAEPTRLQVAAWLPDVQSLLSKAGTAPLDFTLHDDDHSYRVAERMTELIPPSTAEQLSDFELGLLLNAAYLHDVGMNPRREIVAKARNFLLTGESQPNFEVEEEFLQQWLDESHPGVQPPVAANASMTDRIAQAEMLTAHFCRYRHNDWSGDYIRASVANKPAPPYHTWIDDLELLCKSHHYGIDELMASDFDLRIVGQGKQLVNLRYLAAILRVADVLEFDPERTPEIIFSQRGISPQSAIYWYKDQTIVFGLDLNSRSMVITARTKSSLIHKAVLNTADDVDNELRNCNIIDTQNGFLRGVRIDDVNYYKWPWPSIVSRDIKPMPNTFEYIEGAFRPNRTKLLSLLAGTRLYANQYDAIRELMQNAFDAVSEQVAHDVLANSDTSAHTKFSATHSIQISTEERIDGFWLICVDSGIGMTRRVIERYLLVSGSNTRPEVLDLKRRCNARGVQFTRTGEFGIGVLSYFMIADKIVIETRASVQAYNDVEAHGWRFETEGIDAFGELRHSTNRVRGSKFELRIRPEYRNDKLDESILAYVKLSLSKSPCRIHLKLGGLRETIEPGWVSLPADFLTPLLVDVTESRPGVRESKLRSRGEQQRDIDTNRHIERVFGKAKGQVSFSDPIDGTLPSGLGTYRLHFPFFNIERGKSLAFIDVESDMIAALPSSKGLARFNSVFRTSWKNFVIHGAMGTLHEALWNTGRGTGFLAEFDFEQGGAISLNRNSLEVDKSLTQKLVAVGVRA